MSFCLNSDVMMIDLLVHLFFSPSDFCAADDDFRNQFKVPPFQDCMLSFLGFSDDEKASMEEMTEMQGYCLCKLTCGKNGVYN